MGRLTAAARAVIHANAFFLGAVVMGFEMLGSRYLNPYFGGTILTWAALISTVLAALMAGYFVGGALADRHPSPRVLALLILPAAGYMAALPHVVEPLLLGILETVGDGIAGLLLASSVLALPPLLALGMVSPYAVRLLIVSAEQAGRTSGLVYAVSTLGSIVGTLVTAFVLVPNFGSRWVTNLFAACIVLSCASLMAVSWKGK